MLTANSRLSYANRALTVLQAARPDHAAMLLLYVAGNAPKFGAADPTATELLEITDYANDPARSTPAYCAALLAGAPAPPLALVAPSPATYLGEILAPDSPAFIATLCHAYCDKHLAAILSITAFGTTKAADIQSFPIDAIAICSGHAPTDVAGFLTCTELLTTGIVDLHVLLVASPATGAAPQIAEVPVEAFGGIDAQEPNALSLHPEIVRALLSNTTIASTEISPVEIPQNIASELDNVVATAQHAINSHVHGIHIALRSNAPHLATQYAHAKLSCSELEPFIISSNPASDALAQLIALQLREFESGHRPRAAIIDHNSDFLTALEGYALQQPNGAPSAQATQSIADPNALTDQKIAFASIAEHLLTPVVHILDDATPVTSQLVGLISDVRHLDIHTTDLAVARIKSVGARYGVQIPDAVATRMGKFVTNPEDLDGVVRLAASTGNLSGLETNAKRLFNILGINTSQPSVPTGDYDPRYVNCATEIEPIITKLVAKKHLPISLLLYGDPGTSKTSLANHIASEMGMTVQTLRISDYAGKYVGDNEKGLRRAFEKARKEGNFLIIDEADSVLQSRDKATQSWERNTVNEMLTLMDTHTLPYACTTNYIDDIDRAASRRFRYTFKLLPMDAARSRLAWSDILKLPSEAYPERADLDGIAIADFTKVAMQMEDLDLTTPDEVTKALVTSRDARCGKKPNKMGFNFS